MAVKMVTGLMLVDAPASALNNAGIEPGRMAENKVVVKKIRRGRDEFPYVSGQAVKRWWRETIQEKFGWIPSPVTREESVAYTAGNPVAYEEDDLFGYMLAPARGAEKGLVYRRVAPLKCTPLVSCFPDVITYDFWSTFSRGAAEAEPVPYGQEIYSTVLKGAFSLLLNDVGIFERGRAKDLPADEDGKEVKLTGERAKAFQEKLNTIFESAKGRRATIHNTSIVLPPDERKRRIKEALLALPELSGGAKRSDYLTDVAPRFLIVAILSCANHIFMDVIKTTDGKVTLNTDAIEEIVRDYHERLLSPLFVGLRKGFLDNEEYEHIRQWADTGMKFKVKTQQGTEEEKSVQVKFGTPKEAIAGLVNAIEQMEL